MSAPLTASSMWTTRASLLEILQDTANGRFTAALRNITGIEILCSDIYHSFRRGSDLPTPQLKPHQTATYTTSISNLPKIDSQHISN